LLLWTTLKFITKSTHPILTVSSESMEPTFHRGDIILLSNRQQNIIIGDIPVVWFAGKPLPMVHRAIEVTQEFGMGSQRILTKGDNNDLNDTWLYPDGRKFVHREEIVGLVWGHIPYLGWPSLVVKDQPWILVPAIVVIISAGVV
ncbi:signal peptidase I, partial [Clohesyomyces aquaticus]